MVYNWPAMHEFQFFTPYFMPASKLQKSATDLVSYIKITYSIPAVGASTVFSELGFGVTGPTKIPCRSLEGLNPVTGNTINCTLYPVANNPYVIVRNYGEVAKNGKITLFLPHKTNPKDNVVLNVQIIFKANRRLTVSSSYTQNLNFLAPGAGSLNLTQ